MMLGNNTWVQIEQVLNELMRKDDIRIRRRASMACLDRCLEAKVTDRLKKFGFEEEELSALAKSGTPGFTQVTARLEQMGISREKRAGIRAAAVVNVKAAAKQLRSLLYEQELAGVFKRSGVTYTSWRAFLEASGYISVKTAERIADAADMSKEDREEFLAGLVRDSFDDLTGLRQLLWDIMDKKRISATVLRRRTLITARAWAPFAREDRDAKTDSEGRKGSGTDHVSQSILLRLVLGLELGKEDAEEFLKSAGSGFIMLRDLLVLTAVILRIYDSWNVYDILERYAYRPDGTRYFGNIYQRRSVIEKSDPKTEK